MKRKFALAAPVDLALSSFSRRAKSVGHFRMCRNAVDESMTTSWPRIRNNTPAVAAALVEVRPAAGSRCRSLRSIRQRIPTRDPIRAGVD